MKKVCDCDCGLAALAVAGRGRRGQLPGLPWRATPPNRGRYSEGATLDLFLPSKLTVNAGDSVTFSSASFHTVTYAPKPAGLFMPDPAKGRTGRSPTLPGTPSISSGAEVDLQPAAFGRTARRRSRARHRHRAASSRQPGAKPKPATSRYVPERRGLPPVLPGPSGHEGHGRRQAGRRRRCRRPQLRCRLRRSPRRPQPSRRPRRSPPPQRHPPTQ